MPEMNGIEVLKKMKADNSQIKVLILTVHNEMDYLMKAVDIGVDGYILSVSTGIGKKARAEIVISHPRKKDFMVELNRFLSEGI